MRYSYEYKLKCVEMYREGKYPETPEGISKKIFIKMIRKWFRLNELHGPEVLKTKENWKQWSSDEKLFFVNQVIAGYSIKSTAIKYGIDDGTLCQWVRKYKIWGYNGLINKPKGRKAQKKTMKKANNIKSRKIKESEYEELIRLRAENAYIKAENEIIKKEIALREEKWIVQLKAKRQQSLKNLKKKAIN